MAELTPAEAAKVIGVPEPQLRIWAYDKVGPQNSGTPMRPSYKAEHLQQWLCAEALNIDRSIE